MKCYRKKPCFNKHTHHKQQTGRAKQVEAKRGPAYAPIELCVDMGRFVLKQERMIDGQEQQKKNYKTIVEEIQDEGQ